jgi:hypothetical protein
LAGSGSRRVKGDDDIIDVDQRDAFRVSPAVTRCFEAGDEGVVFVRTDSVDVNRRLAVP